MRVDSLGIVDGKFIKLSAQLLFEVLVGNDWIIGEASLVAVEQLEDVAENLSAVAAIDFLDD